MIWNEAQTVGERLRPQLRKAQQALVAEMLNYLYDKQLEHVLESGEDPTG